MPVRELSRPLLPVRNHSPHLPISLYVRADDALPIIPKSHQHAWLQTLGSKHGGIEGRKTQTWLLDIIAPTFVSSLRTCPTRKAGKALTSSYQPAGGAVSSKSHCGNSKYLKAIRLGFSFRKHTADNQLEPFLVSRKVAKLGNRFELKYWVELVT